ncbi:hypothetical protein KC367_g77 [Hortaea werneckii]|nr:hypothetical protein KC367_g77 [Hortaea werneckii]
MLLGRLQKPSVVDAASPHDLLLRLSPTLIRIWRCTLTSSSTNFPSSSSVHCSGASWVDTWSVLPKRIFPNLYKARTQQTREANAMGMQYLTLIATSSPR